jgi:trans-AT polyketide synthase, acyltransferase and oxidoreductase domains
MVTYVFPGQGSQHKGMGKDLFDEFPDMISIADQILGYSIKKLCLEDPELKLSFTQYTQSALFIVNALTYLKKSQETGKIPDYIAGHSLGEYNALFAAGAFNFETGLKLVKKRGALMGQASGGGMAAVIGLTGEQVQKVLEMEGFSQIDIANYNSPFQIVISGPKEAIEQVKPIFENNKDVKMFTPLKVSGAFHSRYMENARQEFEKFINSFTFLELKIPVISNVYARPYRQSAIKENLLEQITHPVQWTDSVRFLMSRGEINFEEIGSGRILTGLINRIQKEAEPIIIKEEELEEPSPKNQPQTASSSKTENNIFIPNDSDQARESNTAVMLSIGKVVTNVVKTVQEKSKTLTVANNEKKRSKEILNESRAVGTVKSENSKQKSKPKPLIQKNLGITAISLGNEEFKKDYNLNYAYLTGGMYRGIASKEMVVKVGRAGMMGFLGTGGMELSQVQTSIQFIQNELSEGQSYGMSFLHNPNNPEMEENTIDLFLEHKVRNIEASAFLGITLALVRYKAKGLKKDSQGNVICDNKIIAKISRPEVAEFFLSPAPERIIDKLLMENKITKEESELLKTIPMANDICVEADSGGHTDGGVAYALMPAIIKLRDEMMKKIPYSKKVRIGAAGGIGTPEAAAAAFILGADFILTGSINQCTVEANTSDAVKDLLQQINVQDTEYAPAGDMFELGAKVQVLKKGVFFPARANKLFDLYRQYNSLNEIDEKTKAQIQERYFRRSFENVYEEVKRYYPAYEIEKANHNPKHKMALIFRWYFGYSTQLALNGDVECKVDFQVHCGPALGAFNQWVKGTNLENWQNRHVDEIGLKILNETADYLNNCFQERLLKAN